jgi:hypothetical protein
MFGLGIAFGAGDTFWGKASSLPLRQVSFNVGSGTGSVIQTFNSPTVALTMMAIGVDPGQNLLGGVVLDTPDNFQLYDLPAVGSPGVLQTNDFPTDNDNSNGTGAVDFGGNRVYALDSNNGILAMDILPPTSPPQITQQPSSLSVLSGSNVTFTVVADGFPTLSYQWHYDGSPLVGATSSNYTRMNAQPADSGDYFVVITNAVGGVVSSNAVLTVTPWAEVRFESIAALPDGSVTFEISGQSGQPVWIEHADQLPNWQILTNLMMSNSTILFTDDSAAGGGSGLYRARQ